MPIRLEIDSLGESLKDFYLFRDELIVAGKKFDAENLRFVPYEKLAFCATGIAGKAMCSMKLVREEKRNRRERFLQMGDDEIRQAKTLLRVEQMDADVHRERIRATAPTWESLRPRQRAWFKLNCIVNHIDGVHDRLTEAIALLDEVIKTHDLPADFTAHQRRKLEILSVVYPASMPNSSFRARMAEIAVEIKKIIPDDEQRVCEAELLHNYSCTSDCYQPLV